RTSVCAMYLASSAWPKGPTRRARSTCPRGRRRSSRISFAGGRLTHDRVSGDAATDAIALVDARSPDGPGLRGGWTAVRRSTQRQRRAVGLYAAPPPEAALRE